MAKGRTVSLIYTNVSRLKNKIAVRGYNEFGERVQTKLPYMPTLYQNTNKATGLVNIHGFPVSEVQPGSMYDCKQYIEEWTGVSGVEIHGQDNWISQFISDYYHGLDHPNLPYEKINIGFLDIETECENGFPDVENPIERINAITIRVGKDSYMFGLGEFTLKSTDKQNYFCYTFTDEKDLISCFLDLWEILDLDVVVGWNSEMFDIPYIVARTIYLYGEEYVKRISPWKNIWKKSVRDDYGNTRTSYVIYGIASLDFMKLYKKYVLAPRESYKLDFIAEVEIGHKKLDWSEKYETMKEFYQNDFQMFMEYNSIDVDLIHMMEDKLQLLRLQTQVAYMAMVNYEDVYSPVRTWDSIIYNHLREQNIIVPLKESGEKSSQYAGAYVMEPDPKMYECVASFDLASLYPNLIKMYNIGPDTIITRGELEGIRKRLQRRIQSL